jgi:hypothetical protein
MEKEKIFGMMKGLILALKDEGKRWMEDEAFRQEWFSRSKLVQEEIDKLNSCDALWLTDEHGKWMRSLVNPIIHEIETKAFPK